MLKPNLIKWGDSEELDGLLFFAQLIEEMLFDYTIDSYKAPAFNTKSRCIEILTTIEDIKADRLQDGTLKPMLEELVWSLESDVVAQKLIGADYQLHLRFLKSGQTDVYTLETRINHIVNTLGDKYLNQIKEDLREIVKKKYLFNWDDTSRIDNFILLEFIRTDFAFFDLTKVNLEKNEDVQTISVSNENNILLFKLNKEKMIVELIVDNVKKRKYDVKLVDGKLNVYAKSFEKRKIELLARLFVTELLNIGFSESEIYHEAKKFFFEGYGIIDSPNKINDFFIKFEPTAKEWEVILKGEKKFELVKEFAKVYDIEITDISPALKKASSRREKNFFEQRNPDQVYIIFNKIEAHDATKAKMEAEEYLISLSSLYKYHIHLNELSWSDETIIYNKSNNHFIVVGKSVKAVHKRPEKKDEQIPDFIHETAGIFSETDLNAESRYKLLRCINLHSAAISENNEENQLLTFWAALESLLPPNRKKGKIEHVIGHLEPFLVSRYCNKLLYNLYKSLINYEGVKEVIDKVGESDNDYDRFVALIGLKKENEHLRDEIYVLIGRNPLLMYRIYSLMTKLSSAKSILDMIIEHQKRVVWHIQRVYRMRNLIIHSGSTLPHLNILVENLHSYTDNILDLIGETIVNHPHLKTLDELMLEVSLHNQSHIEILTRAQEEECSIKNYRLFLYGDSH
jgi:hypothetical protein